LAQACRKCELHSLIISDVIGDPLDVIASGPTAPDPTTFADALAMLLKYDLLDRAPLAVRDRLTRGARGELTETLKHLPPNVHNYLLGNSALALRVAKEKAEQLGYQVFDLGPYIQGETRQVAEAMADIVRGIANDGQPVAPPA